MSLPWQRRTARTPEEALIRGSRAGAVRAAASESGFGNFERQAEFSKYSIIYSSPTRVRTRNKHYFVMEVAKDPCPCCFEKLRNPKQMACGHRACRSCLQANAALGVDSGACCACRPALSAASGDARASAGTIEANALALAAENITRYGRIGCGGARAAGVLQDAQNALRALLVSQLAHALGTSLLITVS